MTVIVCAAKRGEMMFNRRRCSSDRMVLSDICAMLSGQPLFLREISTPLFDGHGVETRIIDDPNVLGDNDIFFLEDIPFDRLTSAKRVILYRWDRVYPADLYFEMGEGYELIQSSDMEGYSHKEIKKEVFVKC